MDESITRIHPDLPVCWETPDTLRVGFERACARVQSPSAATQRLIGALLRGLSSRSLGQEARRLGATPVELRRLLADLGPVLHTAPPSDWSEHGAAPEKRDGDDPTLNTILYDDGREVPGLRDALRGSGLCRFAHGSIDLAVHIERFLEPLERAQRWLGSGTPHLLVRFTDQAVEVGPLVTGDGAPCHTCCTLERLASDPAYPALAAQLYGARAASETAAIANLAAAFAAVFIGWWVGGNEMAHRTRAVIPASNGMVSGSPRFETVEPHPECTCLELARSALPLQ